MSKRTNGKTSDTPTPAPRRKAPGAETAAAAAPAAPKIARSRKRTAAPAETVHEAGNGSAFLVPRYEDIATRAYFIALERGFQSDPVADWLLAEQELRHSDRG